VALALLLALASMMRYPGGTALNPSTTGYSPGQNFLSDLGMTVAYNGQPNRVGALCFVLSLVILLVALSASLWKFLIFYSSEPRPRRFARAAGATGVIVCLAFSGVAVTPENRVMALHVTATLLAWRVFPILSFFLAVASLRSSLVPSRVAIVWATLTVVLTAYVGILGWGPELTTLDGLRVQAVAQKIVAATVVAIFLYLSVEGDRVLARISCAARNDATAQSTSPMQ
jgi:hypothetical protein